jgi:hypothetical protein
MANHRRSRGRRGLRALRPVAESMERRQLLATFLVTSLADAGAGSLRQAILDANLAAGADAIHFNLGGPGVRVLRPASPLPTIVGPATIDGATQPGYAGAPLVEIDGSLAGSGASGLTVLAGASTIRGLAIYRFGQNGITLQGGGGNRVEGNRLGVDGSGATALGNGGDGVSILGSSANTIGGTTAAARNVIGGNGGSGVSISSEGSAATGNAAWGNTIGSDAEGAAAPGNGGYGVVILGASGNSVGGLIDGAGNAIALNGLGGVAVADLPGAPAVANPILSNSFGPNNGPAIDLGGDGDTGNDEGDADAGPNLGQNFPILTAGRRIGFVVFPRPSLTLAARPNTTYRIQYFRDGAFYQPPAGSLPELVTTDGTGAFTATLPNNFPAFLSATATDPVGNTSELSPELPSPLVGEGVTQGGKQPGGLAFSSSDYTVNEADGTVTLTVNRSGGSSGTLTATYSAATGTAQISSDFAASTGTLTFGGGVLSQTITIPILQDGSIESDESFAVELSYTSGLSTVTRSAQVTIQDDDTPNILVVSDARVAEGDAGAPTAVFTVRRFASNGQTATVSYATADGTAVAGADYLARSGVLVFGPGVTSLTVSVPIVDDGAGEDVEAFALNLSGASNAAIRDGQGAGTIDDNDPGTFRFELSACRTVEGAATTHVVIVRTGGLASATVAYSASGGTATAGADYQAAPGTILFAYGEMEKSFDIPILGDSALEGDETVNLVISGVPLGAPATAVLTILDDDSPGVVSLAATAYTARAGDGSATVVVTRTGSGGPASVRYATVDGTARAGVDYAAAAGTINFAPGQTQRTLNVPLLPGAVTGRTFQVALSDPSGVALGSPDLATLAIAAGLGPPRRAPADLDGDGRSDVAVYGYSRLAALLSGGGTRVQPFGGTEDVPIAADYDGDGKTDVAVYGYGRFAALLSGGGTRVQAFGGPADAPVAADFDGDGRTDMAVYGYGRVAALLSGGGTFVQPFGGPDDRFVAADFDGDGRSDVAVYGYGRLAALLSGGGTLVRPFGGPEDRFASADFDGDGKGDVAVYGYGRVAAQLSGGGTFVQPFGGPEDRFAPDDFDGDGKTDVAVYGYGRLAAVLSGGGSMVQPFGGPEDVLLPASDRTIRRSAAGVVGVASLSSDPGPAVPQQVAPAVPVALPSAPTMIGLAVPDGPTVAVVPAGRSKRLWPTLRYLPGR